MMRSKIILCLRTAWVVAALMILSIGPNICSSIDRFCTANDELLFLMFLLTFPFGAVLLLVSMILFEVAGNQFPSGFFMWWLLMACGGSVQWLIVVPELIADQGPISLKLGTLETNTPLQTISRPDAAPLPSSPVKPQPDLLAEAIAPAQSPSRVPAKVRARRRKRVRPFDALGRTPLERVIHRS